MSLRTLALAALAALIPSPFLTAQETPPLKHDLVVTATRIETPEKKVGSSLTVISGEELLRTGKTFVLDALESALGLSTVRTGGPGAASSVSVRGANSEHTLFLLDGVELNDPINPSRSYDVSHLPLSQVERVEILRGPQGLLYGSDALGGVVNIITKQPVERGVENAVMLTGGSYGDFRVTDTFSFRHEQGGVSATGGYRTYENRSKAAR